MSRLTRIVLLMAAVLLLAPSASLAWGKGEKRFVGPGDSIQAAVDAAAPGTTILVAGRHRENVLITKDGITLRGAGAVLEPPTAPAQNACVDPADPTSVNGLCVLGDVDLESGEVRREVSDVTISGFTIRGFGGSGIFAFGAHDATFKGNVAADNGEYGLAAFTSTGTRMAPRYFVWLTATSSLPAVRWIMAM